MSSNLYSISSKYFFGAATIKNCVYVKTLPITQNGTAVPVQELAEIKHPFHSKLGFTGVVTGIKDTGNKYLVLKQGMLSY